MPLSARRRISEDVVDGIGGAGEDSEKRCAERTNRAAEMDLEEKNGKEKKVFVHPWKIADEV